MKNVAELYAQAYALHQAGQPEAAAAYRKVLKLDARHLDAWYMLGTLYAEQGVLQEAQRCLVRALHLRPSSFQVNVNLGNVFLLQGDLARASEHLEAALRLEPALVEAAYSLASVRLRQHRNDDAIALLRQVIALRPGFTAAHVRLAGLLEQTAPDQAVHHLLQATELEPANEALQIDAGNRLARMGKPAEATACFARALGLNPANTSARFALAALQGITPDSPPQEHVASLFDSLADSFDSHLEQLGYSVPAILRALYDGLHPAAGIAARAVDLGCGTGLSGAAFKNAAQSITGVDVSERMLAGARAKGIYRELVCSDVVEYLGTITDPIHLIIATDVFIYVGALDRLFGAVRRVAASDACFVFSTERHLGQSFHLEATGRYSHSTPYILSLAEKHGFAVAAQQDINVRMENHAWIPGQAFALRA